MKSFSEYQSVAVGSGFAGLAAANCADQPVHVFDNLRVPGGRARLSQLKSPALPDLGPSFAHGTELHQMLREVCFPDSASVSLDNLNCWICDSNGKMSELNIKESPLLLLEALQSGMQLHKENISVEEWFDIERDRLNDEFNTQYLNIAKTLLSADTGAALSKIGVSSSWDGSTADQVGSEPTSLVVSGGLGKLAEHLCERASNRHGADLFHFRRTLVGVDFDNNSCRLLFRDHESRVTMVAAESVFLSMPVDRIKGLSLTDQDGNRIGVFEDLLDRNTRRALNMIEMGKVVKIVVKLARPVTEPKYLPAHISVADQECASVWLFPYEEGQSALLYLGGDPAVRIAGLSKPELDQWIRGYLKNYLKTDAQSWNICSWVKGSGGYSYIIPDRSEDEFRPRRYLEAPQLGGKLFLGGEACTTTHPTFVAGAINTGKRFAEAIRERR
jgi:hypothetical protein